MNTTARKPRISLRNRMRGWLRQHAYSLMYSIGNLLRHPLATLMTTAVLGIALCLPLLLWTLMGNLQNLRQLETLESITVFLQNDLTAAEAIEPGAVPAAVLALQAAWQAWPEIQTTRTISPIEGMAELQSIAGFGQALELLDDNPLPWVLQVIPAVSEVGALDELLSRLEQQPGVESAQADWRWLQRLQRILELVGNALQLLALLFAVGIVLVISNTIRLDIQNRQDEIDVLALTGATHGFIRRPFLYTGFWYGALGGCIAVLILLLAALWVGDDLARLSDAYSQEAVLWFPSLGSLCLLLLLCGVLGQAGAYVAVSRRLQHLNPL